MTRPCLYHVCSLPPRCSSWGFSPDRRDGPQMSTGKAVHMLWFQYSLKNMLNLSTTSINKSMEEITHQDYSWFMAFFLCLVFSCLSCLSCLLRASPSMTAPQMPFLPSAIGSPGPSAANGVENAGGLPRKPGDMEAPRDGNGKWSIYRCGFPLTSNISIIEVFSIIFHCQVWFMEGIRFYGKETSKTPCCARDPEPSFPVSVRAWLPVSPTIHWLIISGQLPSGN